MEQAPELNAEAVVEVVTAKIPVGAASLEELL